MLKWNERRDPSSLRSVGMTTKSKSEGKKRQKDTAKDTENDGAAMVRARLRSGERELSYLDV